MSNIYQLLSRSAAAIGEVAELVRAGADLHDRSLHISKRTVLEMASAQSNPQYGPVVRALVQLGSDVNAVHPSNGQTPLHLAARYAPVETIRLLASLGANTNARDNKGKTPAFYVLERTAPNNSVAEMREALLALFDAGADSLAKDDSGMTLLKATRGAELKEVIRSARIHDRIVSAVDTAANLTEMAPAPAAEPRRRTMSPI